MKGVKGGIEAKGIMWMLIWLALNVFTTLMNKAIFQFGSFHFPVLLSAIHMFFSFFGSAFMIYYDQVETVHVAFPLGYVILFSLSVVFCLNISVSNISLRLITISLSQVIRSTIPAFAMSLSAVIMGKTYTKLQVLAVVVVCVGVALATKGEIEFHVFGTFLAFVGCFLSALKAVQSNMMLGSGSSKHFSIGEGRDVKFHPYDLLNWLSFFSFWEMLVMAYFEGETEELANWDQELLYDPSFLAVLCANGFVAFLLNVANFNFITHTSALTVTICGNVKSVLTILISVIVFQNPISPLNFVGTVITLLGASYYSFLAYNPSSSKATV